jgi:flagellar biosynthesis protein FlhA
MQFIATLSVVLKNAVRQGLGAPILLVTILAMVVLPLPPAMLDLLFTFNIFLALIVMLVSIYTPRPLDFAAFPIVLLIATLLRLALNIASTRVVLLRGHEGPDAAGRVIEAFGEFVIGGNYAVGLVVFAILVIINFIVVTKGATRVSEVSARFTLDAMPGKQMAIDADLNAGIIDQDTARRRREETMQEADFYGSMDGASKFVRGDAVAAILILFINIFGGLLVGTMQHGLSIGDAARSYTMLTVGDGLVAQVPALLLSTAAGVIVTRVTAAQDMGQEVVSQLFDDPRALAVASGIVGFLGLVPGMPNLIFLSIGGLGGWLAWRIWQRQGKPDKEEETAIAARKPAEPVELGWDDVPAVDPLGLEVGYRLIPLVDRAQSGEMLARIKGVRKKLSQELGFLVPAVHVRDNLDLPPASYRISIRGVVRAQAELQPGRELAIDPGQTTGKLTGIAGHDPVFGMDAVWIDLSQRQQAQAMGYTVVDASTVVATHMNNIMAEHADELFGHEEAQQLVDRLASVVPRLVEDLIPKTVPMHVLVRVLQNLLRDRVPIRDMRTILETLAQHAADTQDAGILTAHVRTALGRMIYQQICGQADEIGVVTLDPSLEQILRQASAMGEGGGAAIEPGLAERLQSALLDAKQQRDAVGEPPILLVPGALWPSVSNFVRRAARGMHVMSFEELPDDKQLKIVATIGG